MAMTKTEKSIRKIIKKTAEDMTALGTYRTQFDPAIRVYAEMKHQLNMLNEKFYAEGCNITEQYTNKAGATNERKTALYMAIETLRRDIADREEKLGLTPSGMKKINEAEMKARKKVSKLTTALNKIGR